MRWPKSQEAWKPRAAGDVNSAILYIVLGAVFCLALGIAGWETFLQMDYVTGKTSDGIAGSAGFGQIHVVGFAAALYLGPAVGALALTATGLLLSQPSAAVSEGAKVGWLSMLAAGSCAAAGVGAQMAWPVLSCGILWCTGVTADLGTVLVGIGLWIFWLSAGFAVLFGAVLVKRVLAGGAPAAGPRVGQAPSGGGPPVLERAAQRQRASRLAAALGLALVVIPFLWVLSALLPNAFMSWNRTAVASSMVDAAADAEDSTSWLQTGLIRLSGHYTLKAYPDTTLFYGFLEVLALGAAASAACPPLEALLGGRRHPRSLSLGEKLALALFAVMLVLWFIYWLQSHVYHEAKSTIDPVWLERLARTFGLTAVLFMALNLLPACKNSLWHEAFGISWERGLWTHRWLGGAAVFFMTLHILTMFCRYIQLGSFPYDAIHLHQFYPINYDGVIVAGLPNYDNWTISTQMLVAYPALFVFGVLPLFRNRDWEIFKYTHFFFLVLVPSTLIHAESSWYFLVGGIAFYLVDAAARFVGVASPTAVLSAKTYEAEGGVVELQISKAHPYLGAFAWVNVPAVSTWEWHPFSLASSPYDGVSKIPLASRGAGPEHQEVNKKTNMGSGTFTDRLYRLVRDGGASALTVQLDGAYGPMFDPADHAACLLVGGGIGITQVHSTLRTLAQMAQRSELPASLRLVRLVWIGRSAELFRVLDDSIGQCLQAGGGRAQSAERRAPGRLDTRAPGDPTVYFFSTGKSDERAPRPDVTVPARAAARDRTRPEPGDGSRHGREATDTCSAGRHGSGQVRGCSSGRPGGVRRPHGTVFGLAGSEVAQFAREARGRLVGSQATTPLEPLGRQVSCGPRAEKAQTVIVFDWDDTLFPTTYVKDDLGLSIMQRLQDQRLRPPKMARVQAALAKAARAVEHILQLAGRRGKVVIVTLAKRPWVTDCCESFYPGIAELIEELDVQIVYAQEGTQIEHDKLNMLADDQLETFWAQTKGKAISKALREFYSQYEGQSWKNIISLGGSHFERYGTMAATMQYAVARGLVGEEGALSTGAPTAAGACLASVGSMGSQLSVSSAKRQEHAWRGRRMSWEGAVGGQKVKVQTKTVKMLVEPTVKELIVEMSMLRRWLPLMVGLDNGFDVDLNSLDDEAEIAEIENTLRGREC
ncbi:unnamed protein product [Prorocentrum cordatum]|uniref:FAD-binding FR-type domain-containing protein n=1 Tax=Prorocentrum cordatum TaxID=2364126 RepID=A0ABN9V4P3_9DINO|nr:unnamed protein product [Polarella glacialis]